MRGCMTCPGRRGFSLVEVLSSLVITGMILVAAVAVYNRIQSASQTILARTSMLEGPLGVIQLIADDLAGIDGLPGTQILIDNKRDRGMPTARLVIRKTMTGQGNQPQVLEEITWQAAYDLETGRLTLYRAKASMFPDDRLLDRGRSDTERLYPFVPVCQGLSLFKLQAPQGPNLLDRWASPVLPAAVVVTVSFAEPVRTTQGLMEVRDEDLVTRTIAIDPLRNIRFELPQPEPNVPQRAAEDQNEPNSQGPARGPVNRQINVRNR